MNKKLSLSLYWKCQLIGWSVASLYWGYTGFISGRFNLSLGLLQFATDVGVYILLTHLYRDFALSRKWQHLNLNKLLYRIIPAAFVLGLSYTLVTVVKVYLFQRCFVAGFSQPFSVFFELHGAAIFIGGMRLMSIWVLAYHLYHYAQREINITKENARLEVIARDAQLNNLTAQLNPHFLFNSLNNIKALIIENPKSARRGIDLLSDLLRTGLYGREMLLTTVHDELDLVRDYLELEKLRLEDRLQQKIETDNALNHVSILRWSIQALVENAVKHGIGQQKEGGLISIQVIREGDFIKISVQNPGVLRTAHSPEGVGLRNLKERLQLMYKGRAKFAISNRADGTVLSAITVPIA